MTSSVGPSDELGVSHAQIILQQLENFLTGDYSSTLPTDWQGIDGEIANVINEIVESRELLTRSLLSTFQSIREPSHSGTSIDLETLPGRMGDVVKGLNEMRYELLTQLQGLEVMAKGEGTVGLEGKRTPNSDGIFSEVQHNVSAMLFVVREGVLGRAMNTRLTSTIAKFNQNSEQSTNLVAVAHTIIREMAELIGAVQGRFYERLSVDGPSRFSLTTSFSAWGQVVEGEIGDPCDRLIEEAAEKGELFIMTDPPLARYQTLSSFGDEHPWSVAIIPIVFNNQVQAIIELAAKHQYPASAIEFMTQSNVIIGLTINNTNLHSESEQLLAASLLRRGELEREQENLRNLNHELEFQTLELQMQRKKIEKTKSQLERKTIELELSSKYKSQFFSKMSHELRTPITSLLMLSELLRENPKGHLDASELEFAKMIHSSSEDLLALINDILDLSKIEAGLISLNMIPHALVEIIHRTESTFRQVAQKRNLDFNVSLDPNLPSDLITDELRLRQIINNLLSNAFKYTEKGEVSFQVERVRMGWSSDQNKLNQAKNVLAFTVKDSGVGIPSSSFGDIFKMYNRGEDEIPNKFGGTGVGLAISHEIAQMMGGELRLMQSAPNQGSTFTLFLPMGETLISDSQAWEPLESDKPQRRSRSAAPQKRFAGRKVLVVDDNENTASSLCAALTTLGLIPYSQSSGLSAIAFLEQAPDIELVFMDCAMPEMDGVETITRINNSTEIKKLPIIVLTAQETESDRMDCMTAGACEYAGKPLSKKKLISLVQRWLP